MPSRPPRVRRRRRRRGDRRPRHGEGARPAPRRPAGGGAGARAEDRGAPERPDQRRDPRGDLLPARLAEGPALRGRRARALLLLRASAESRAEQQRQGDRRHGRGRAGGARRAGAQGAENEVAGLRRIGPDELREIEPHATGIAALHSPETGVVDFAQVAASFAAELERRGGRVVTGCAGARCHPRARGSRSPTRAARPRPPPRSAARAPGRTAWRPPAAPRPSPASFPSAAPTCGCAPSAASWSGAASIRSRIPSCPSSACT